MKTQEVLACSLVLERLACQQANGPGGGGFNRAFVDDFLGAMATRWPGVRHVVVHDTAQAAEHFAGLTRVLAEQPFRAEVSCLVPQGL